MCFLTRKLLPGVTDLEADTRFESCHFPQITTHLCPPVQKSETSHRCDKKTTEKSNNILMHMLQAKQRTFVES